MDTPSFIFCALSFYRNRSFILDQFVAGFVVLTPVTAFFSPDEETGTVAVVTACEESCAAVESVLWAKVNAAEVQAMKNILMIFCMAHGARFRGIL